MPTPNPTPIFRFVHIDNLETLMRRGALHAPNHLPADSLPYRFCHDPEVQGTGAAVNITVGPNGTIHDYVPFYFGYRSPSP
ncbi:MAG: DarT ssDNA thymidine ADP-ribosyltransferase family protein [Candidatus Binatia bacterium]